jgi:hypothetical protein
MLCYTYVAYLVFLQNPHLPTQLFGHACSFPSLFTFPIFQCYSTITQVAFLLLIYTSRLAVHVLLCHSTNTYIPSLLRFYNMFLIFSSYSLIMCALLLHFIYHFLISNLNSVSRYVSKLTVEYILLLTLMYATSSPLRELSSGDSCLSCTTHHTVLVLVCVFIAASAVCPSITCSQAITPIVTAAG